jgi:para-aminobenzoate synthetase / 4-amino-4-deoxychorismate lyase
VICSASPELFYKQNGSALLSRPMKGTAPRGRFLEEDEQQREWLLSSEKNRAENIMIVDMIRNDMGRVAITGSVRALELFTCEKYPSVWQMTSAVAARTKAGVPDVMAALFPCASITGAPKVNTMAIISRLEKTPRRVYTGCIGYIASGRRALFSVAIRTALIDRKRARAEYGTGGGIVWQSDPAEEYAEALVKSAAIKDRFPVFSLLESLLWTPENGYFLFTEHLSRCAASAEYFGYPVAIAGIRKMLLVFAAGLPPRPCKVRLLVDCQGNAVCETAVIKASGSVRLAFSREPVDLSDRFLFHKTTHRAVYEKALHQMSCCDDVLLWNNRGEITETCTANVVVEIGKKLITPPRTCGLLAGTFREHLLNRHILQEGIIKKSDLRKIRRIFLINSVRKWKEAILT